MKISNGCTNEQISFENPISSGYTNPNAPANGICHTFKPQGGGVTVNKIPQKIRGAVNTNFWQRDTLTFTGGVSFQDVGTSDFDLSAGFIIKDLETCEAINRKFGQSASPIILTSYCFPAFTGTYTTYCGSGFNWSTPSGARDICVYYGGSYYWHHVLIPR